MARPLIEARHFSTFSEEVHTDGWLAGASVRELSRDAEDGAFTAMVRVQAGSSFRREEGRSLEMLVLKGHGSLGDEELRPNFYGYLPPTDDEVIRFDEDSTILWMTGEHGTGDGPALVVDPDTVPWRIRLRENIGPASTHIEVDLVDGDKPPVTVTTNPEEAVSVNITKFLRAGANDGSSASFGAMFPGSGLDCAEYHRSVDEGITLRGDLLLYGPDGNSIEALPGSYIWRPANARHLPKYSHTGHLGFGRTRETGWNVVVEYEAEPRWPDLLATYQAKLGATFASGL